ncbi:hypothetical protein [Mycolicibacterium vaccae]|uniref:hypothetical protein n=1 Tax=Mycolicibacterium vaccae TaxID=1810 RepID=UPI003D0714FC
MPKESELDTSFNAAALDDESVTQTSADHAAEKAQAPSRLAEHMQGQTATEDTVDVEREK